MACFVCLFVSGLWFFVSSIHTNNNTTFKALKTLKFSVAGFVFLVLCFWFLVSGFWFLVSGFWFLVSGFWF